MRKLLLVDGHAFAYRAYYAIRSLTAPDGVPTNAIYGFIGMVSRARQKLQPTHIAVVWDGGLDAKRTEALPGYKAQRPEMPADLSDQIEAIHQYERAAGMFTFQREGLEADDLIAGFARQGVAAGMDVVIASPDKDFFQLVSEHVGLLNPTDKTGVIWGEGEVVAKTGVRPAQIVDWLSLLGDAVDNIDGVPGVGPKTATRLLQEHGSVDGIYQQLGQIASEKLRCALASAEPVVRRNQGLVRLRDDLDVGVMLETLVPAPGDVSVLGNCFKRWGFRSMLAELKITALEQEELFGASL